MGVRAWCTVLLAVAFAVTVRTGKAQTVVYWDTNGRRTGATNGSTAAGTWDQSSTANWTTTSAGTVNASTWSSLIGGGTGIATFSAGTNATGPYTVTVSGTVTGVAGLTFEEGTVTLSGGNITLASSATIATGANDASISSIIGGTGFAITKTGSGDLDLTGANTYTGGTTISGGTISVTSLAAGGTASGIGKSTSAAANLVINGGTLKYNGAGSTTNRLFTLGNGGGTLDASGTGTLNMTSTGSMATSGTGSRTLTLTGSNAGRNVLSAAIGDGSGGSTSIEKTGSGEWVLAGNNSFTGTTTLTNGTLIASGSANALGAGGANVNLAGGVLVLANDTGLNFARNLTVSGNAGIAADRATAGAGVTHTMGTLSIGSYQLDVGSAATNTTSGVSGLTFGATTLTGNSIVNVVNASGDSSLLTLGALNDGGTARTITKSGNGTLTLASAATSLVNGTAVNITGGTLNSNQATALGATTNVSVSSGATFNVGASQTLGALNGSGTVTLGSNTLTVGNSANNLSSAYSGPLGGAGNLVKAGSGTLTLSGSSTGFTGGVSINAGTLLASGSNALGSGSLGTTVASGAALGLSGGVTVANGTLTLNGTGVSNSGALYSTSGSNTWNGSVALASNTSITNNGTQLTLGAGSPTFSPSGHTQPTESGYITIGGSTLTFNGSGTILVNDRIRDFAGQTAGTSYASATTLNYAPETTNPGSVVIDMSGGGLVHYYANANSYTGTTYIKNGTLLVDTIANGVAPHDPNTDSFHAINGAVEIGNGSSSAALTLGSPGNELLASTATIKLYHDGTFNLNGQTQTIDALTFSGGGTVQLGTGSLFLNNDVTVTGASGQTALIDSTGGNGYLSMTLHRATGVDTGPDATRTFTVSHGAGNTSDLTVNAIVQAGSLVKAGNGTMTLTGANTYTGTTSVNAGILNVQRGTDGSGHSALGSSDGTDAQGTTVASGATLQIQGGIGITTEKLNLNGSGYNGAGALENVSGNNTWGVASTARINLQSNSRINSDSGRLGIATNITSSSNNAVTFGGAGNTTVSGGIITGTTSSTTVTKDGTGTLTLSGANSYQGATAITQGVVSVQNNFGLGAATTGANGTIVSSGAQLQLDSTANGNLNIAAEGLTLNGTGIGNTGALLNAAGTNTYGGPVSLGSSATIAAKAGTALTVSGGISSANAGLTVGTSGNTGSVTVNGTVNLGSGSLTKVGAGAFTYTGTTAGVTTGTVGAIALNGGSTTVGDGTHVTTLNSTGLTTASGTSLLIATGGTMSVTGSVTLSGTIDSNSAGTLQINGGNTLTFNSSINAANLTLVVNGGSIGTNAAPATLYLGNLGSSGSVTVGNIHITGDTILDFGNSAGTFLSSTNLVVDANAKVTVVNWISVANSAVQSTIWYLRNLSQTPAPSLNSTTTLGNTDIVGGSPLNQISFTDPVGASGSTSTWVSGDHDGWFDHEIRPTPEPSTYGAVFVSACLGLFAWRRYRRRGARAS